jgi:uncharacterized membrane protein
MAPDLPASPILDEYLAELERAAADLPVALRAELLADIRAHVAEACAEADDPAGAIPAILAQLGDPAEIVEAARADLPPAEAPSAATEKRPKRPGALEAFALVLLIASGLMWWVFFPLPLVGWFAGLALLCASRHWTLRDKLIGFAGAGLAPMLLSALIVGVGSSEVCSSDAVPVPTDVHGHVVTSASASGAAEHCTTSQAMPSIVAIAILVLLLAGFAFALWHLSRTRPRTGLPAA